MVYTIIVNRKSYDLPKKTIDVLEKLDDAVKIDSNLNLSLRDKFKYLLNFLIELFGEEKVTEMLGSTNLKEIDLSEITLTIKKIVDAYDKPIRDYDSQKMNDTFKDLPIDQLGKIKDLIND